MNPATTDAHDMGSRSSALRLSFLVLTTAPILGLLGDPEFRLSGFSSTWAWALVFAVAAAFESKDRVWPRALATLNIVAGTGVHAVTSGTDPGAMLWGLLAAVGFLAFVWPSKKLLSFRKESGHVDTIVPGLVAILVGLFWLGIGGAEVSAIEAVALTLCFALPAAFTTSSETPVSWRVLAVCLAGFPLLDMAGAFGGVAPLGLISPTIVVMLHGRGILKGIVDRDLIDSVLLNPSRFLVLTFALLCAVGTAVLTLPQAASSKGAISVLDAAFTAVSASCVTGLIVLDTPNDFGSFGQLIILLLIQIGGLGIMVFSAAAVVLLGRRFSLKYERVAADIVGASGRSGLFKAIRKIFAVTFISEGIGASLLSMAFYAEGDPLQRAIWRGVFTAISAFCNAGFALQSDSLVPYADNPFVLAVVGILIVVGGLGPVVVGVLVLRSSSDGVSLHVKIVLAASLVLIVGPAIWVGVVEWNTTLGGQATLDRFSNAIFQSVTLRTAGFNSIDLAAVEPATWTMMVIMMFIGGSPGSTAGGVKTTTIVVIGLAIAAAVRGSRHVECFGRTIPAAVVLRATAVTALAVFGAIVALVSVQLTQTIPLDQAIFEVISALATVGLSTGATGALDEVGKIIIIVCMFAGRVGPLTLFVFLSSQSQAPLRYPEESVPIG